MQRPGGILALGSGASGGQEDVDPSDHDQNDLSSGASGGVDGYTHVNGPLGEYDRWLRSALENSSEIVKVVDPDGTLRYASPAFGRVLGHDPEEAAGRMNVLDHVHPDDLSHVLEETGKALSGGGATLVEYRFRHKDGSWRWMESAGTYLPGDPAVEGVVVNTRDVTKRKEAEEALRKNEERYRIQSRELALLHQVRSVLARELDPTGVFYEVVETIAETYGYTQVSAYLLEGEDLLLQHQVGYKRTIGRIPSTEGVCGRTVRTGRPVLLENVRTDPGFLGAMEGITSEICVPLFDEGQAVGCFNVESTGGVTLTQNDLELMVALGEHVSVAVSRAKLHTRVRNSEEHFRALTQNSSDLITLLSAVGTIHYQSPSVERILGYRPEETIGDNAFDYIHPDDRERAQMAYAEGLVDPGRRPWLEYRFRRKDGSWIWLESVGSNLLDDPGVGEYVVNSRDVTGRRGAEEALKAAEERYRNLVEQIPAVTYIDRADGSFEPLYTSPQIEGMLGYTPEEWRTQKLWEKRLHPDDRERVLAADERLEVEGEPFGEEYRLLARDGSVVWVHEEAVLIRGGEGEPLYWQGVIHDVTAGREAGDALRRSEALLAESQRIAHLGTWEWDVATGEVWWSEETYRIHGLGPEGRGALREKIEEAFLPGDLPTYKRKIDEALSGAAVGYDFQHRIRRPDGEVRWVHGQAEVVRGEGGEPLRMIGTVHDVTERKHAEELLEHQAFHDSLTGLPNRRLLLDRLGQALGRTKRRKGSRVAVLLMDLDNFKVVNDSLGHEAGDLLLVAVAERLRRCLRPEDTLTRFGGDEFVVLVESVEGPEEAVRVAERITEQLRSPFVVEGRKLHARASIGIALGEDRTKNSEDLLRDADTAMYRAKEESSGYSVFDPAMYERAVGRLELEHDLRRAVEQEEFVVHYQPIIDLGTRAVWGMEAVVRWDHPERGLLSPSEFVPVAEETGLIIPMGRWVLGEACHRTKGWQDSHPGSAPLAVIVNFSAAQLRHPECVGMIEESIREAGLGAGSLGLDVTESAFIDALEGNVRALGRIKRMGVRISIDDFGTGYSSLSYLKRLPADTLKIDKSFVGGLGEDPEDTAIVRMVVELAHTLGMEVIAEGVETGQQAALLEEMGCDMAQGYHFAKPLSHEAALEFLAG